jgi:competence protein ComEC
VWAWALPALSSLAGCALQLQLPQLWSAGTVFGLLGAAIATLLLGMRWRRRWIGIAMLAAAALALGFGATHLRAASRLADALPPALEGQDLRLTGTVASLPRESIEGVRFLFKLEVATHQGQSVALPPLLSLGWFRGVDDGALLGGPAQDLRAGQRWRFTARLRQPHGNFNPHGFDAELWLFEQGVRATGSVRSRAGDEAELLAADAGHTIHRARQDWRDAINRRVSDPAAAGVLAALAVGDQAAIDRADWETFRITGVAHLMAISGLHVTMFAWLAALLVGRLWRLHPRALLVLPAPVAARWGGLIAALGYAQLAGFGVPAQRTVWMIAVVVLLRQAGLRWPLPAVLLAAAVAVTVLDPWALLQPGFWLSFVAVGLLVVSEPMVAAPTPGEGRSARLAAAVRGGLRTQVVATVGLAPLSMIFFQQVSLVGFLANLVAIPLVTLLITPLAMLGLLLPVLWSVAATLVQGLGALLQALTSLPMPVWHGAAAPAWAVASGLLGGLLAVLPLPWRLRAWALPLMLPLLAAPVQRPPPGSFEAVVADVGQGTAVIVRTRHHLLVYDAGPAYSRDSDAGLRVLVPLLRARGEDRIDRLMLSHRDADHVGGAAALLRQLPVAALSSSLEAGHPLLDLPAGPHTPCAAGQSWSWDGVRFELLHPLAEDLGAPRKSNALSCVLRVAGDKGSLLLTGDIEADQEAALVRRAGAALRSDVLLVPHHGSRTSSTAAFLDAVASKTALVQAGYRSRYGHPSGEVLERYRQRGIALMRSDRCGAFTLSSAGASEEPACERSRRRRYWHHPGQPKGPIDGSMAATP